MAEVMRRIIGIFIISWLCIPFATAQLIPMSSVNSRAQENSTTYTPQVSEVGATDAPMLGSTAQTPYYAPRRIPGGGGGVDWDDEDTEDTDIELPLSDGLWCLLVLAFVYGMIIVRRKRQTI